MSRLRVVAYAINGRGMGHLVRQLAILRWVRRLTTLLGQPAECWILTSSEADTLARREGVPSLKMPSKAMIRDAGLSTSRYLSVARAWVLNAVAGLQPDLLLVDTFPGGSFGELVPVLELAPHRVLVARAVRDRFAAEDAYQTLLPVFDTVIAPDDGGTGPVLIRERSELLPRQAAREALGVPDGARAVYVSLGGGGEASAGATLPRLVDRLRQRGWHVVVGAGPLYEGPERRGDGITWLDRYTPIELLPGVDAAVAAAGYNTFHELMFAGVPTVFLPLPRIADDQEARARRAVDAGAGRLAPSIDAVPDLLEDPGSAEAARALVPENGARRAAAEALSTVLPAADLAMADAVLTDDLLGLLADATDARQALELVRLLSGGTPAEVAERSALVAQLGARGHDVPELSSRPEAPAERSRRFVALCRDHELGLDTALHLLKGLDKKFPAARGGALIDAAEVLIPVWARFDDWMGAVAMLRAVPVQRTYPLTAFATELVRWLAHEEDLFDALRDFSQLEGRGERTVAETLRLLVDAREAAK